MCVIIVAKKNFPKLKLLQLGESHNRDGGGMAWIGANGRISYKKGITAIEMAEIGRKNPVGPWLIHFRMATMGGDTPHLAHPFPVTEMAELNLEGQTDQVMAHNGHWSGALHYMNDPLQLNPERKQEHWSDSRMMAIMLARYGNKFADYMGNQCGQRVALFSLAELSIHGSWGAVLSDTFLSTDILWYKNWFNDKISDFLHPEDAKEYEEMSWNYWDQYQWGGRTAQSCDPRLWEGEGDPEINIELVEEPSLLEDNLDNYDLDIPDNSGDEELDEYINRMVPRTNY